MPLIVMYHKRFDYNDNGIRLLLKYFKVLSHFICFKSNLDGEAPASIECEELTWSS
jgi:hypothetical protein